MFSKLIKKEVVKTSEIFLWLRTQKWLGRRRGTSEE